VAAARIAAAVVAAVKIAVAAADGTAAVAVEAV